MHRTKGIVNQIGLWLLLPLLAVLLGQAGLEPSLAEHAAPQANKPGAVLDASAKLYMPLLTTIPPALADLPPRAFWEPFDGAPTAPQPFRSSSRWDITVHSRDVNTFYSLEPVQAHHGSDCGPPTITHTVTKYEDTTFICRNHLMTALNTSGYGVIYFTPAALLDLTTGEAVVRFDMSTSHTSLRDWVDVWITPLADQQQLPLETDFPDLNGPPRNGLHVRMNDFNGAAGFTASQIQNFEEEMLPLNSYDGYDHFLTPDAARRDTFEIRLTRTHIRVGMPAYNYWWVDAPLAAPLKGQHAVVQFGHHSYNPSKCEGCSPNTWHWDNVVVAPSTPFTMIPANRRYAEPGQNEVQFAQAAPANSYLRFAGIGEELEVSFDGGQRWQTAGLAPQVNRTEDHFRSYWMAIPSGTQRVLFRGQDWYAASWQVRDLTLWTLPK